MKLFSKIIFIFLLLAGILMAFLPISWFPSFYDVRYSGWSMIFGALIIYIVPGLFGAPSAIEGAAKKNYGADLLRFLLALAIIADALGALGLYELYQYGFPNSYCLHIVMPFIGAILLARIINLRFGVKIIKAALISFVFIMLWALIWEIFENMSDLYLNTHLVGMGQTSSSNTTIVNLIQDTIGASCGLILILAQAYLKKPKP
jgi:hypothetical protein